MKKSALLPRPVTDGRKETTSLPHNPTPRLSSSPKYFTIVSTLPKNIHCTKSYLKIWSKVSSKTLVTPKLRELSLQNFKSRISLKAYKSYLLNRLITFYKYAKREQLLLVSSSHNINTHSLLLPTASLQREENKKLIYHNIVKLTPWKTE